MIAKIGKNMYYDTKTREVIYIGFGESVAYEICKNIRNDLDDYTMRAQNIIDKYKKVINENYDATNSQIQRCNVCAFSVSVEKPIIIGDGVKNLLFCNKLDAYVFGDKIACEIWTLGKNLKSKINKINEDSKNKIESKKVYGPDKNSIPKISEEWAEIIRKVYFGDQT